MTSWPVASSEEIEEVKGVPLGLNNPPTSSDTDPFDPIAPAVPPGFEIPPGFDAKKPTVPINARPISIAFPQKPGRGRKCKISDSDEKPATKKAKLTVKNLSRDLALLASSSETMNQPRAHVEAILSTFDAIRRRLEQINELDGVTKRSDMKAEVIMSSNDLMANKQKRVGPVPGVQVGDIFYFRMEMCAVGLHALPMAGIDSMIGRTNPIAIAIVSSGGYDNDDDDVDVMVYTGQGGNSRNEKKRGDQKLERGNYAMEQSDIWKNPIRVIRSRKDPFSRSNKVYIYDGLYRIKRSWTETSKFGFKAFKHKLVRVRGQPDGFAIWKMIENWKREPSSRGMVLTFDLSSGVESIPVAVVNEVDDDTEPDNFLYVTTIGKEQSMKGKEKVPAGCKCRKLCAPGAADCYCMSENGGWLPYSSSGLLVKRLPLLYECGSGCECIIDCRNRVTQRGVKLNFEVFKTQNCGWGLRSWDPIRAGSFVCEFVGTHLESLKLNDKELDLNEYLFCTDQQGEKALKWNRGMELATEDSGDTGDCKCDKPEQVPVPVPVINAKEMGNVSRFINHSCDPNLFWQLVCHGNGDEQYPHVMFFALKHIPPMTELTYDYNGDAEGSRDRAVGSKNCLCGTANCRSYFA
ncbi:hypothetical protein LUZ61_013515 [Rhynchospora tenuis]|uniref:Uncharacterized protein n=1 Tax=Rhynchospora tenuis TaxID=198213 RepID=A0AAD5Z2Q5_9POAL|nr:hypothetical protein LUZ61_013515 [Rhynchospora tenuis]